MNVWVGDDGNLHYFAYFKSEVNGVVTDQSFIGMLPTPPGESVQRLFQELSGTPPLTVDGFRKVRFVPEPMALASFLMGLGLLALAVQRRH